MKNRIILTFPFLFACFATSFVYGQNKMQIKGNVADEQGSLPGVSIIIKEKQQGTTTDAQGNFILNGVNKGDVLQFSYIGYDTYEFKITDNKNVKIILREDTKALDEVVVVGYQEVKKRDLTGAIGKANMDDLLSTPVASFDQALGGRVAGVNVSSNEGMPGGGMNIVIRGNNSLTQSNSPLYVIDGFPTEDSDISSSINPADIESIDILKDASATAIYGARGANGVVIITTKKGTVGAPKISYDGSAGIQHIIREIPLMDAYEFVKLQAEVRSAELMEQSYFMNYEGKQWTLEDYRNIPQYNWQDEIFRTAWQQNHSIRLTGGSQLFRYNASVSYYNQDGVVLNSNYDRFQSRLGFTVKKNKLNSNFNVNYSHSTQTGNSPSQNESSGMYNLFYSVWGYRPVTAPNVPLSSLKDNVRDEDIGSGDYRFNPILSLTEEYRKRFSDKLQINGSVEYEFIDGLKLKVSGILTKDFTKSETFNNSKTRSGGPTQSYGVNASVSHGERTTWLNENVLTYQTNFKKKHFINLLGGITLQNADYNTYSAKTVQITNETLGMAGMGDGIPQSVTSTITSWSMLSYLGRINYNYKSKYYATASFRADGSSKFRGKNRFGYFPSASLAWNFSEEHFMKSIRKYISNGKFRLSWGQTGNNRVDEYATYALLEMLKSKRGDYMGTGSIPGGAYPFNNDLNTLGAVPTTLPNKNLKWETTTQWNVGLDLSFLRNRIDVTMDWYHKVTDDLLLNATLPASCGYVSATKNIGKVSNTGFELTINTTNIKTRKFRWTTNFNIAFNKNKVLELAENQDVLFSSAKFDNNFNSMSNYIAKVGQPMGMMYGFIYEGTYKYDDFDKAGDTYTLKSNVPHFVSESNTQPGFPKYKDLNEDGVIDFEDQTIIGNGMPKHTGGFSNNFQYSNFDINIFFQWSYGNDILNANKLIFENNYQPNLNQFASYADRWTPENPTSDIPCATSSGSKRVYSSRIIEDGSFLRLKSLTLGYTFPKSMISKVNLDKLRLYVAGQNLWTLTNYSGYDPEVSVRNTALTPGMDYSAYPRAWSINFGVNINF